MQSNATNMQSDATNMQSNATKVQGDATNMQSNATKVQGDTTNMQSNATKVHPSPQAYRRSLKKEKAWMSKKYNVHLFDF
ncbi:hypothetical protein [Nostoc sp. XA010]|uniref:hypothetical protein n=1 Tax=Nostoc sp. XA010 TaxID=2780407 RepID=UPI001E31C4C2|nr:hypothetical protein [Nostoc sp. XA010]